MKDRSLTTYLMVRTYNVMVHLLYIINFSVCVKSCLTVKDTHIPICFIENTNNFVFEKMHYNVLYYNVEKVFTVTVNVINRDKHHLLCLYCLFV